MKTMNSRVGERFSGTHLKGGAIYFSTHLISSANFWDYPNQKMNFCPTILPCVEDYYKGFMVLFIYAEFAPKPKCSGVIIGFEKFYFGVTCSTFRWILSFAQNKYEVNVENSWEKFMK